MSHANRSGPGQINRADQAPDSGKNARRPRQFRWADWRAILGRVWTRLGRDRLSLIAAGVAFYGMLAFFPGIAAVIGLYGMIADPAVIASQMELLASILPPDVFALIESQVDELLARQSTSISLAALLALAIALWGTRLGVASLMQGLSIAYNEPEDRGLIRQFLVAIALTGMLIALFLIAVVAILVVPVILDLVPLGALGGWAASLARWPILAAAMIAGLALLYRYGPNRSSARIGWVSWGAVIATLLWLIASIGFSVYVSHFASYNETYGSIGAVVGLLMWFWISAFVVLLGAELNAEMEHHTRPDTTVNGDQPLGQRGAWVADHVAGEAAGNRGKNSPTLPS
jgi:membrane protein